MIQVVSFANNPFQENTYILHDETKEAVIIDPGCYTVNEQKRIVQYIKDKELKLVQLINTHCHLDHICGNAFIQKQYGLELAASPLEQVVIDASQAHGRMYGFEFEASPNISKVLNENETIQFGNSELSILFTPGHSPGSLTFYSEVNQFAIVGDVIFFMSIGRTDLPGGNHQQLLTSIREKIFTLPDETTLYNGHGQSTKVGFEKKNNPFFN